MDRFWLKNYPPGVPADVDVDQYSSLVQLMEEAFAKYAGRNAYAFMDRYFTFAEIDRYSKAFGAWLQGRGLERGARVAIMMPNVVQYPIALAGVLRAGYVVVNVNPLYTPRELEHQLKDSGAEAIIILENFCTTLQQVIAKTPVKHVVVASIGDMLGFPKGIDRQLRRAARSRRWCRSTRCPGHVRFSRRARRGRARQAVARSNSVRRTSRSCSTPAARPACRRARRSRTATSSRTCCSSRRGVQPALNDTSRGPVPEQYGLRLRAAAVPRVRAHGELPRRHPPRRAERADREPARHRRASSRSSPSTSSTCIPGVNTLYNALAENPEFQQARLLEPAHRERRRHGRAAGGRGEVAQAHRRADHRGLRPVGDLAGRDLQPDQQSREYNGTIGLPCPEHRDRDPRRRGAAACRSARRARSRSAARR